MTLTELLWLAATIIFGIQLLAGLLALALAACWLEVLDAAQASRMERPLGLPAAKAVCAEEDAYAEN